MRWTKEGFLILIYTPTRVVIKMQKNLLHLVRVEWAEMEKFIEYLQISNVSFRSKFYLKARTS